METVGPSALVVAILYFLSRWALASVDYAGANPGKGHPEITWRVTWWLAIVVSLLSAFSVHMWLLRGYMMPEPNIMMFNGIVFGGFLAGWVISGHFDHRVRLGAADK